MVTHASGHAARAARNMAMDQQLLAVQPGQQVIYEDSYTHTMKNFNNQLPVNLVQSYSLDGQLFADTMNSLNSYLDKTAGEIKSRYFMIMMINVILLVLTFGLWIIVYIFVMFILITEQEQKQREVKQEVNKMIQKLNNSQLSGNGFEWKLIHIFNGIVLRLVYTGTANLTMPPPQQQMMISPPQQTMIQQPYGQPMNQPMYQSQAMMPPQQQQQQYINQQPYGQPVAMNQPGMITQPVTLQPVTIETKHQ